MGLNECAEFLSLNFVEKCRCCKLNNDEGFKSYIGDYKIWETPILHWIRVKLLKSQNKMFSLYSLSKSVFTDETIFEQPVLSA